MGAVRPPNFAGPCRFCGTQTVMDDLVCMPCWSAGRRPGQEGAAIALTSSLSTVVRCRECHNLTSNSDLLNGSCSECRAKSREFIGPSILTAYVVEIKPPTWLTWLHQRARRGQATRYAGTDGRMLYFDVNDMMREKWEFLRTAERVYIVYRDKYFDK